MKSEHYQIEMLWKCKSGHADQLGRSLTCAICGSPKNEHQEYYMPGDISQNNKISGDLKPLADDGPNWSCKWCKSSERNSKGECHHCGGEKAAKKESDVKKEADSNSSYDTDDVDEKIPFKDSTGILLFKIAGVLGVFILVFLLVRWSDHKGTVQSVKISCDYDIEEKTAVVESGFDVPSDAFDQETLGEIGRAHV